MISVKFKKIGEVFCFITITMTSVNFTSGSGIPKCLGIFCGRVDINGTCGACPRGYRTNGYYCEKCTFPLSFYDWLYLGFMALLLLVLNCHLIDYLEAKQCRVIFLHISVILETIISAVLSILVIQPVGKLNLYGCRVKSIKDWYTVFFNPRVNYVRTVRCTQEAVYPIYTVVFVYLAWSLPSTLIIRSITSHYICHKQGRKSLYGTLYLLPILTLVHALFAGLFYYSFPYITLLASSIGCAIFLSVRAGKIWSLWKSLESVSVLIGYCLANAFGLISLTQLKVIEQDGPLLILTVLPILFYLLTYRLTAPGKFS